MVVGCGPALWPIAALLPPFLSDDLDEVPHVSSNTATVAVPRSVGGWVNSTPACGEPLVLALESCERASVEGVSPALVAERLGHDLKTLLRTYAHVIHQDEDRVRAIVDVTLGGDADDR
jgi:hypothetical protein